MTRKERIIKILETLKPRFLDVIDNSLQHAGHREMQDNTSDETHLTIKISAEELDDLRRIEQHRKINNLIKTEFPSGLHALSIIIVPASSC